MKLKDRDSQDIKDVVICPKCGNKTLMRKDGKSSVCDSCAMQFEKQEVEKEVLIL